MWPSAFAEPLDLVFQLLDAGLDSIALGSVLDAGLAFLLGTRFFSLSGSSSLRGRHSGTRVLFRLLTPVPLEMFFGTGRTAGLALDCAIWAAYAKAGCLALLA